MSSTCFEQPTVYPQEGLYIQFDGMFMLQLLFNYNYIIIHYYHVIIIIIYNYYIIIYYYVIIICILYYVIMIILYNIYTIIYNYIIYNYIQILIFWAWGGVVVKTLRY